MSRHSKILLTALVLVIGSCVTPFDIDVSSTKKYLVVEANLNDIDKEQIISINITNNFEENTYNSPLSGLKVELIVNRTETINLIETKKGIYALPFSFRIVPGAIYQLRFQMPDGTLYESSEEKTSQAAAIDKIFDEFVADGIKGELRDFPANYVYLDFRDKPNEKDFYVWTWTLWENQRFCKTDYYDYYCSNKCWEILPNKDFNVFSDVYSNGKTTLGKLIAKIPYYSFDGALLEIRQQAVSEQAYHYFKLLTEQTQTNGTLVDTPPAAIVGNIKNISNPTEPVGGVFSVATVVKQKYWLNRENGIGKAIPVGLLGRMPVLVPNQITYPCLESPTRTPTKPEGWVD